MKEWETVKLSDYDNATLQELLDLQKRNIIKTSLTNEGILFTANSNVGFEANQSFSLVIEPKITSLSMMRMIGFLHGFIHAFPACKATADDHRAQESWFCG